ncbi:altronate hydrolase [Sediminicola luteus]|uniref:Altronate hydrolase n=2 Tax=Sediminicola luteus TaxID=319238 RepID=A0A2A4G8L7_9FLAO|nr:altronate hydrolase [Sediminicola luteus]
MDQSNHILVLDPKDNVGVALFDLQKGDTVTYNKTEIEIQETIPAKHKFALSALPKGAPMIMYGQCVGELKFDMAPGARLYPETVTNKTENYSLTDTEYAWQAPKPSQTLPKTFLGYHRSDGQVGTRNVWLVFPLVFCENKTIETVKNAMEDALGISNHAHFSDYARSLWDRKPMPTARESHLLSTSKLTQVELRFITHHTGCGGTRSDAQMFCRLMAGYLNNPNVAGATVLSLGCQNAQVSLLNEALKTTNPNFDKPLLVFEHQQSGDSTAYIKSIIEGTLKQLRLLDSMERQPAPLSKLSIGLECGGSDGFSGISANPMLGMAMDKLVGFDGKAILAEFPELAGTEASIIKRCVNPEDAKRFVTLMQAYEFRAEAVGSGFKDNPSPGNIREGLITDAMKSAGAVRKGGTSPVNAVLDYGEYAHSIGLSLLCTPGNDVESTTALAGSGANLVVFTTGLGTPTGNPVSPVIKVSSNTDMAQRMAQIIDFNAGTIISGEDNLDSASDRLLELIVAVASGKTLTKAELRGQHDFIPWKRDISL